MRAFLPRGALDSRPLRASRCPARHRFPIAKYTLLRARVVADGLARAGGDPRDRAGRRGRCSSASTTAALLRAHPRRRAERARAARPRAAVVAGAGRARPPRGGGHAGGGAPRARARRRDEPRRRHPPRRPRVRPRLLPVQRRRRSRSAQLRATGLARARAGGRLRRPPGRRHRRPARRRPARVHALAARRAQLPVPAHPLRPRRRPRHRHRRRRLPRGARQALDVALRRRAPELAFYLAGADPWEGDRLGRLALTKAGLRARDELVLDRLRAPARPSASCSRAATPRTCATPSTSTRRPPRRSPPDHGGEGNRTPLSLQRPRAPVITTPPGGLQKIARTSTDASTPRSRTTRPSTTGSTSRPTGWSCPTTCARCCAPPTARSRSRSRSSSPTGRPTSSPATACSTTARAGRTRAASATTRRSTSTRCARWPR